MSVTCVNGRRLVKRAEAAKIAQCSPRTIDRLGATGVLRRYGIGPRSSLYDLNELEALILNDAAPDEAQPCQ